MRVAHLTTVDLSLRYLVLPQLEAVLELGGEAIGISAGGPHVAELEDRGIRHLSLPTSTRGMNVWSDVRAAWDLARILVRERPDVLHTHNPKPGLYGRVVGRLTRVPVVVNTVHGLYATPDDSVWKRALVYSLEAIASRFSHIELVQNPEDFELITRLRLSPRHRTRLLGNGVNLGRFRPLSENAREQARQGLDLGEQQIAIAFVGRLVEEKGLLELFAAVRELNERYVLFVIGPNDLEKDDALPMTAIAQAQARGVRFLGMRTDVEEIYGAMDIFVLPSHREGFPRTAMEAAASGLPIVATDIRGCRQVVVDGQNGILVPVRNPGRLAAAIMRLGEDSGLRRAMGQAGQTKARNEFDEKRVVEIVIDSYLRAGRAKGLTWASSEAGIRGDIRPANASDASILGELHASSISGGFLSSLGPRFLGYLYRSLIGWQDAVVVVADDGHGPIGFVAGVTDTAAFFRQFRQRLGPRAALVAAPHLLTPAGFRKAMETWRYGGDASGPKAELLAMAVSPAARNRGHAGRLVTEFLSRMDSRRSNPIKLVVGADNHPAISVYRRMGFVENSTIELHDGTRSLILVRQPPS